MKISFKLRSLKSYLVAALAAFLLGGAVAAVSWYSFSDNPPAQLWGVDDTTWVPVAWNSDTTSPTRENPVWIEEQVELRHPQKGDSIALQNDLAGGRTGEARVGRVEGRLHHSHCRDHSGRLGIAFCTRVFAGRCPHRLLAASGCGEGEKREQHTEQPCANCRQP